MTVAQRRTNYEKAARLVEVLTSEDGGSDSTLNKDIFDLRFAMIKVLRENVTSWTNTTWGEASPSAGLNAAIFEFYAATATQALAIFMDAHCGGRVRSGNDLYDLFVALDTDEAKEACLGESLAVMSGEQASTVSLLLGAHRVELLQELMSYVTPPAPPPKDPLEKSSPSPSTSSSSRQGRSSSSPEYGGDSVPDHEHRIDLLLQKISSCKTSSAAFSQRASAIASSLGISPSKVDSVQSALKRQIDLVSVARPKEIVASVMCPILGIDATALETEGYSALSDDFCEFLACERNQASAEEALQTLIESNVNPAEELAGGASSSASSSRPSRSNQECDIVEQVRGMSTVHASLESKLREQKQTHDSEKEIDELKRAEALSMAEYEARKRESMEEDYMMRLAIAQSRLEAQKSSLKQKRDGRDEERKILEQHIVTLAEEAQRKQDEANELRKKIAAISSSASSGMEKLSRERQLLEAELEATQRAYEKSEAARKAYFEALGRASEKVKHLEIAQMVKRERAEKEMERRIQSREESRKKPSSSRMHFRGSGSIARISHSHPKEAESMAGSSRTQSSAAPPTSLQTGSTQRRKSSGKASKPAPALTYDDNSSAFKNLRNAKVIQVQESSSRDLCDEDDVYDF